MRSLCENPVALKITAFYERGLHLAEFLHKTPNFDLFFLSTKPTSVGLPKRRVPNKI